MDRNSVRYVAWGREVWDLAWSNPLLGTITAGSGYKPTRYPSLLAAMDAADSLNENEPQTWAEREDRFQAAAAKALKDDAFCKTGRCQCEVCEKASLLPAWVDGIDALDTL